MRILASLLRQSSDLPSVRACKAVKKELKTYTVDGNGPDDDADVP